MASPRMERAEKLAQKREQESKQSTPEFKGRPITLEEIQANEDPTILSES